MPSIGPLEMIILLMIVLLLFGARRVPEIGRSIGQGIREFKDTLTAARHDEPVQIEPSAPGNRKTTGE